MYKMAGYGRFMLFTDFGNVLCARNNLLNVYQSAPRNAFKYLHDSAFPPKPKKPQSAFFLYLNHVRSKFMQENPNLRAPEIVKKASEKWAELDPLEKEDFRKQYSQNYEMYVQELKAYNDSLTDEQKQLIQQNKEKSKETSDKQKKETFGKPKKPLTAFLAYMLSKKNEKDPNLAYKNWLQVISTNWNEMSDTAKQPYVAQATESMMQYRKNVDEWEKKMISLGHSDIVRRQTLRFKQLKKE
ncbi:transcription factor A, mitochondrial-like [Osmia bicornis bicornis]|uniref:transcription factor A, mitochondrial-like n=1 Tax=Osmia bicornis bicornis TaxID=1437191 RepID=UPI0010F48EB6|nr:transcription factor A, mitochondrial-like [Osmia bicornis bicornis]